MIGVDASVLATALGDDGPDGDYARTRLRGERLSAPELVDLEVTSVLRRQVYSGAADLRRAVLALADLAALPLRRAPHRPLLARCWELRDNLAVYDACYVALAEALDVTLLTGDGRLAYRLASGTTRRRFASSRWFLARVPSSAICSRFSCCSSVSRVPSASFSSADRPASTRLASSTSCPALSSGTLPICIR